MRRKPSLTIKTMTAAAARRDLRKLADPVKGKILQRFFKTGPGEYAEGDKFLGVTVPQQRLVARRHRGIPLGEIRKLLRSKIHEERLVALLLLVWQYPRTDRRGRRSIFELYVRNTRYINNWDLVDCSAHHIVGPWLEKRPRALLDKFARSSSLWERRIAMLATLHFIRQDSFSDALRIARILLRDEHDLIHKAVGWMLREIGNRDRAAEKAFLKKHASVMPRTMLRYAIEKFPEPLRQRYLRM